MEEYLEPTRVIDSKSRAIVEKVAEIIDGVDSIPEIARRIFFFVRDQVKYTVYAEFFSIESYIASNTLTRGDGYCVQKSVLLAAMARAAGIPARLCFADIRNHIVPEHIIRMMGTNLFTYHGYDELYINGSWVKATPSFDKDMCEKHGIMPVAFDGKGNALLHRNARNGRLHIEYIKQYGHFPDLPLDRILKAFERVYGVDMSLWKK